MTLEQRARAWRSQGRRALLAEAGARAAAGTSALLGAAALADRWAALPGPGRSAVLVVWAAWLASLIARKVVAPWRALDWDAVFAEAAAAWPETRAWLASAWALRAGPAAPGTSEELRAEHVARAERLAAGLPDRPLYRWTPSPAAKRLALAAAVVLAADALGSDRASWARVLAPWRDAALESWVVVAPGDARADWGAAAAIDARPSPAGAEAGVRAGALALEARGADGAWRALPWTRVDDAGAEWRTASLAAPLAYRVRWRDRTTRAFRLEPVAPPRWSKAAAVVREARGEKRFVLGEDSGIRARRGDWVELECESDEALASASLRVSGRAPVEMRLDRGVWKGGFLAQEDGALTFELAAADGRRDPAPPSWALTVAADAPPTAELLSPQVPLVASPEDSLAVTWAARDDSAVTRAALVISAGGRERAIPLQVPGPPAAEALGDQSWPLRDLKPGDRAEFWIEAWDDASPPQRGLSERGSVELVDAAADHAAALEARSAADAALDRAAARAEAARDAARKGDLAASSRETEALKGEWSDARRALDEWAKRAQADPRGDPGLAEEAARAAQEFARAGEDGLPEAAKALAAADAAKAAREHDALAEQARGVQQALREGARAQEVQDFSRRMSEAGDKSDGLSRAADELAARGKEGTVSAAELEKLEQSLAEVEKALDELRKAVKQMPEVTPEQAGGKTSDLPLEGARQAAGELRRALESGDVAAAAKAAKRLAEQLRKIAQTLDSAGRRAAEERGRRGSEAASKVKQAWDEAVEAQTKAVESARRVEDQRLQTLLGEQKALLGRLEAEFGAALSSPTAAAAARAAGAEAPLGEAARRLRAADAPGAGQLLRGSAALLRAAAAAGRGAPGGAELAGALDGLSARLAQAPAAPPAEPAASRDAADVQRGALDRARVLRGAVQAASEQLGFLSGRLSRRVDEAIGEEGQAEGGLRRGDSGPGLQHAEAALAILQQGQQDADNAASAAGGASGAMGTGAGAAGGGMVLRSGGRGASGARYERVRLPSADDYRPPRELREELERSLREPRPPSHDSEIKEYFKRLTR